MDERTQISAGGVLLVIGAIIVLLFAFPASTIGFAVPIPLAIVAALAMAAGTLLIGTSEGTV
ncbi:hypothetical protein [Halococcus thailandensis]|uniref:Uncharacterized protein n=1 Tax=Halococcus thailandensis JCM 13552 TaxID=1227457 RepID=M0MWI6_9EURY|nr:hypothetical protein [Halococcus thailandensis]EMA49678.1 hypothetical protein C451_19118 [Halococcus thailandensis JCM 13552]